MIREHDTVVLTQDLPQQGLTRGDIGTVVLVHDRGKGFEVEFTTLNGRTIAVETLFRRQVRAAQQSEIAHARGLAAKQLA